MDVFILLSFVAILIGCVIANLSILYALLAGYLLFAIYAFLKGNSFKDILKMSFSGIKSARNILFTFVLIGILTALWRASGTIPSIVCYSMKIMNPRLFVLITFLLNCLVSFLTGTAFGTAATMGSICMTVGLALGTSPVLMGGAILSGAYFGDRCSPVSTSALLVSELTSTDLYENIIRMLKTALIPFLAVCAVYFGIGMLSPMPSPPASGVTALFEQNFNINAVTLIPAALILILSLAKVKVKLAMSASILAAIPICVFCQQVSVTEILRCSLMGFRATDEALSGLINGGGIISMLRVSAIVCISSSYSGIFSKTGLLEPIKRLISKLAKRLSPFTVVLMTSAVASAVACNQTLSIMLTEQLCRHEETDRQKLAIYLENSAVVIAPLIPWSIAGGVPLSSVGAPTLSIAASFFLILLPLYSLIAFRKRKQR